MTDLIQNALVALVTLVLIPLIIPPLLRLLATLPEPWRGIIRGFLDALKTASQTATTQAAKKAVLTAEQMVKPSAAATPTEKAAKNRQAYDVASRVLRQERGLADAALQTEIEAALAELKAHGTVK